MFCWFFLWDLEKNPYCKFTLNLSINARLEKQLFFFHIHNPFKLPHIQVYNFIVTVTVSSFLLCCIFVFLSFLFPIAFMMTRFPFGGLLEQVDETSATKQNERNNQKTHFIQLKLKRDSNSYGKHA